VRIRGPLVPPHPPGNRDSRTHRSTVPPQPCSLPAGAFLHAAGRMPWATSSAAGRAVSPTRAWCSRAPTATPSRSRVRQAQRARAPAHTHACFGTPPGQPEASCVLRRVTAQACTTVPWASSAASQRWRRCSRRCAQQSHLTQRRHSQGTAGTQTGHSRHPGLSVLHCTHAPARGGAAQRVPRRSNPGGLALTPLSAPATPPQGFRPRRSLEVLMFTSEEPTRFGLSCSGSRAMAGAAAGCTHGSVAV
jgi:hypothetical protein